MNVESQINALLTADEASVQPRLAALLEALTALSPADLAPFVPKLCQQIVESRSPHVAGSIAVAAGALVEDGAAPEPLAVALLEALGRWLPDAGRHAQSPSTADDQASAAYASLDLWWRAAVAFALG